MANATMATESPVAVATSASDTPPVITVGAPISPPTAAKERIIPTTVPKRPSNGAIVTIMLSQLRPRFKRSSMYPTTSCKRFSKPSALYTDSTIGDTNLLNASSLFFIEFSRVDQLLLLRPASMLSDNCCNS